MAGYLPGGFFNKEFSLGFPKISMDHRPCLRRGSDARRAGGEAWEHRGDDFCEADLDPLVGLLFHLVINLIVWAFRNKAVYLFPILEK